MRDQWDRLRRIALSVSAHSERSAAESGFASLLREWRQKRRLSQLDLALSSGVSQRHVSFLE
jgi:DNA-binding XRE family transcriptional regulator